MPLHRSQLSSSDWLIARWMLIIRPAVVTATLGAALLVLPLKYVETTPIIAVLIGTYILTLLYWMAHYVSGVSRLLLATQIAFDIFIITVIVNYTGGYRSVFFGFYLLSIMCAALFFRRLVTYTFAAQAALFFLVDVFFIETEVIPQSEMRIVILQTILYTLLIFAVGFFSSYFAEKFRGTDTALANALRLLKEAKLDTVDILQSMTNGLIAVDTIGRIMYMNKVAESILEVDSTGAVGKYYSTVLGPRTEELVRVIDRQLFARTPVSEMEITVADLNGASIPLGLSSMPLYDIDGGRRGAIVHFKDLTDRRTLLEMLRQSERMAAIGELSAAIAHEIRNPLASINNAVEMLNESVDLSNPQDKRLFEVIEKESGRLQQISTEFLDFARLKNPDVQSIDLGAVVSDVLILIDNDPRKTEHIVINNTVPDSVEVMFDADQLRQLVINVIINSLEALEGTGTIELSIETLIESGAGVFIRLIIADDGPGFRKDALGSMFEPFYSTKKNGTGLGLALVRKIAVGNGGRVFARNRADRGAEVILDMKKA